MALTKCRECRCEVSSEAVTCPQCGIKSPAKKPSPGVLGWGLAIATSLMIANCISMQMSAPPLPETDPQDEARFKTVRLYLATIKSGQRNPDSVVWEQILSTSSADIVCIRLRSQNGLGGYTRQFVIITPSKTYRTESDWHKQCASAKIDMANAAHQL